MLSCWDPSSGFLCFPSNNGKALEHSAVQQLLESRASLELQPGKDGASWIRKEIAPNTALFKERKQEFKSVWLPSDLVTWAASQCVRTSQMLKKEDKWNPILITISKVAATYFPRAPRPSKSRRLPWWQISAVGNKKMFLYESHFVEP